MKKLIISLFLPLSISSFSQVPDWTKSTCEGSEYNMMNELNNGNAVLMDFSAMWSTPSNTNAPKTEALWQEFGAGENQLKVFGFLYQDNSFNIADCYDEFTWTTAHGLTYPAFTDIEDILFEYANEYTDGGSVGLPWLLLFLPGYSDLSNEVLAYQGYDIEEVKDILYDVWVPQLGINETQNTKKELVKIVDQLGRETSFKSNTTLIYVYSDGSTEKRFTAE